MPSYQYEIVEQVKDAIKNSADLNTLLGTQPKVYYDHAPDNLKPPYFIVNTQRVRNIDTAIFEGELCVKFWYYSPNAANATQAEELINELFNKKMLTGTNVRNCRFWTKNESNSQGIKKDHVVINDMIFTDIIFYMRWIVKSRIKAAEF